MKTDKKFLDDMEYSALHHEQYDPADLVRLYRLVDQHTIANRWRMLPTCMVSMSSPTVRGLVARARERLAQKQARKEALQLEEKLVEPREGTAIGSWHWLRQNEDGIVAMQWKGYGWSWDTIFHTCLASSRLGLSYVRPITDEIKCPE